MQPAAEKSFPEWPTLWLLALCYSVWLISLWMFTLVGFWALLLTIISTAFHSSLQHELLHGHPTRSPRLNEALGFPSLGLWFPYRRYRALHLRHHRNEFLTDPLEDPESWYLYRSQWSELGPLQQRLLQFNATLGGRLILGPALSWFGFWREEFHLLKARNPDVIKAWGLHVAGMVPVVAMLMLVELPLWVYLLLVAYPATSIVLLRSFIEHRAAEQWQCRTAIIDAGACMSLLYLNNNLHAVHHEAPSVAWYHLPKIWRSQREQILQRNGGYYIKGGYGEVMRQWLVQAREPIQHPYPESLKPTKDNRGLTL